MSVVYGALVALLVYFGASLMSLQMISFRYMWPYFGGGVYVGGSIISMFMAAMAAGYSLGGYFSKEYRQMRYLLSCLLVASLWVTALPLFQTTVCEAISLSIADPRWGSLLAMTILFFVPVMAMAMTSPFIIGILASLRGQIGLSAGLVLSVSTFGSFLGTIGTSFYLIGWFQLRTIVMAQGGVGLALVIGLFLAGLDARLEAAQVPAKEPG